MCFLQAPPVLTLQEKAPHTRCGSLSSTRGADTARQGSRRVPLTEWDRPALLERALRVPQSEPFVQSASFHSWQTGKVQLIQSSALISEVRSRERIWERRGAPGRAGPHRGSPSRRDRDSCPCSRSAASPCSGRRRGGQQGDGRADLHLPLGPRGPAPDSGRPLGPLWSQRQVAQFP